MLARGVGVYSLEQLSKNFFSLFRCLLNTVVADDVCLSLRTSTWSAGFASGRSFNDCLSDYLHPFVDLLSLTFHSVQLRMPEYTECG